MTEQQNQKLEETVLKERGRLLEFIRQRVPSSEDAEDILQDVFYQLVESSRLMKPIERVTSWLFTVARNKIIDGYRKKKPETFSQQIVRNEDDDLNPQEKWLNSTGIFDRSEIPDVMYARKLVWEELEHALSELPEEQSAVFVMHELEDISFKKISEMTGESVNTLLSRKRYAVLFLRKRMREIYDELI